jgi:hypothetical protein
MRQPPKSAAERGTAITETLLIFVPMLLMFNLVVWVMLYWQNQHFDHNTKLMSEVIKQNSTYIRPASDKTAKDYDATLEVKITDKSADFGSSNKGAKNLAKRYFTVSEKMVDMNGNLIDNKVNLDVIYARGINSWVSFPFLHSQSPDPVPNRKEQDPRVEWFNDLVKPLTDDLRKKLQLGS